MKKRYWIPIVTVLILVGIRIVLPFWVEDRVNKALEDIPGYTGSISDVDLHLYRGAYTVDSLVIDKVEADNEVPFLSIDRIDFSVEWGALFNGAIAGEIWLLAPEISFVAAKDEGEFGVEVDWAKHLKELTPIRINRFVIRQGTIRYLDLGSSPQIDLPLENLDLDILNISNVESIEKDLPTSIFLKAVSIGGGNMNINARANLLKTIPDIDLNFDFEEVNLPALNNFLEAYASVDAEQGEFNLYSEIVIDDGMLDGYVKPIIRNLKIINLEEGNVLEVAWEGIVGLVTEVFENQSKDQFASQVPLEGNLKDPEAGTYPAIWNIFRNAFVNAFSKQTGNEINFGVGEEE